MKRLPILLCLPHAALTAVIYGATIADINHRGFWPLIMFVLDIPVSLLSEAIVSVANLVPPRYPYLASYICSGVCCLVLGSAWYYFIGKFIRYIWGILRS